MSSGASSAAEATPSRQPLSVRLMGRGSLLSAAVVVAVAAAYAVVLPRVSVHVTAPPPPRVIDIGGGATVSTTDEWSMAQDSGVTTLTQGGATLTLAAPREASGSVGATIVDLSAGWVEEAPAGTVATSPRVFTAEAGYDAATVVIQEPLLSVQAWVVSDGSSDVIAVLEAPPAAWDQVSSSAQSLVQSLDLSAAQP